MNDPTASRTSLKTQGSSFKPSIPSWPMVLLIARHVLLLVCPTCTTHVLRRWLKRLMLWRKVVCIFHPKRMVQLARFILAPQVCWPPSKRIWFVLLSKQDTSEFRLVPVWSIKRHLACSQPSGTNQSCLETRLLAALFVLSCGYSDDKQTLQGNTRRVNSFH